MGITAIETSYKGYRFRSRLEARWAVFLDAVNLEWRYEPEGFNLDGLYYLPDFFLPSLDLWLEIKPTQDLTDDDREKVYRLDNSLRLADGAASLSVISGDPWSKGWEFSYLARSGRSYKKMPPGKYYVLCEHWMHCPLCGRVDLASGYMHGADPDNLLQCMWCDVRDRKTIPDEKSVPGSDFHKGLIECPNPYPHASPLLVSAYHAARSARFEHGESGACR